MISRGNASNSEKYPTVASSTGNEHRCALRAKSTKRLSYYTSYATSDEEKLQKDILEFAFHFESQLLKICFIFRYHK